MPERTTIRDSILALLGGIAVGGNCNVLGENVILLGWYCLMGGIAVEEQGSSWKVLAAETTLRTDWDHYLTITDLIIKAMITIITDHRRHCHNVNDLGFGFRNQGLNDSAGFNQTVPWEGFFASEDVQFNKV